MAQSKGFRNARILCWCGPPETATSSAVRVAARRENDRQSGKRKMRCWVRRSTCLRRM